MKIMIDKNNELREVTTNSIIAIYNDNDTRTVAVDVDINGASDSELFAIIEAVQTVFVRLVKAKPAYLLELMQRAKSTSRAQSAEEAQ